MSSKTTTILENAKKGQRITISAVRYGGLVTSYTLRDDKTVYATSNSREQLMGHFTCKYNGDGPLRVEIEFLSSAPKPLVNYSVLSDVTGAAKCSAWTIAAEDLIDKDYTDLVVSVVATNKI